MSDPTTITTTTIPTPASSIRVEIRQQYGNTVFYPLCESALRFAAIAGTATLTERVLTCVKGLGYDIVYVYTTPKELP